MKTIQIVIDEPLLRSVDKAARRAEVNRSRLFRNAVRAYLKAERVRAMEVKQRRAYEDHPEAMDEPGAWDKVITWPRD